MIHVKKSLSLCSQFLVDNKIISDKQAVANGFNSFFINTGTNLAKSILSDSRSYSTLIKRNTQSMASMPSMISYTNLFLFFFSKRCSAEIHRGVYDK